MAQDDGRGGLSLPWLNILGLGAALAGMLAAFGAPRSSRPAEPAPPPLPSYSDQDVDARLWQDPLGVASGKASDGKPDEGRSPGRLSGSLTAAPGGSVQWIIPVMIPGGPYAEASERRLRTRVAVLQGLARCGFVPVDGEHIGYCNVPWPAAGRELFDLCTGKPIPVVKSDGASKDALLLPYERCVAAHNEPVTVGKVKVAGVLILWVNEEALKDAPLHRLAWLLHQVCPPAAADLRHLRCTVLGPSNSTRLAALVSDARHRDVFECMPNLPVCIYSPSATAADALLVEDIPKADRPIPNSKANFAAEWQLQNWLGPAGSRVYFERTISRDDVVIWELLNELKRRSIYTREWDTRASRLTGAPPFLRSLAGSGSPPSRPTVAARELASMAVVSEWDTAYGRALPVAIEEQVLARTRSGEFIEPPSRVRTYHYLRGLDGRIPGEKQEKGSSATKSDEGDMLLPKPPGERAEGTDQTDSLQRLTRRLLRDDAELARTTGRGFEAIGVVGSDAYDKLLVLRTLRPQFPRAAFFTTALDARMTDPDEADATRNLVVSSHMGLELHPTLQGGTPPFRDAYQTSMYLTVLYVAGHVSHQHLTAAISAPRLYEVGRYGAMDLSVEPWLNSAWMNDSQRELASRSPASVPPLTAVHVPRPDLHTDLDRPTPQHLLRSILGTTYREVIYVSVVFLVIVFLLWVLFYGLSFSGRFHMGLLELWRKYLQPALSTSTGIISVLIATVVLGGTYYVAQGQIVEGEPGGIFSGVSAWPTIALRWFTALLTVHFIVKIFFELRRSQLKTGEKFDLGASVNHPAWWLPRVQDFSRRIFWWNGANMEELKVSAEVCRADPGAAGRLDAQRLWREYQRQSSTPCHIVRVGVMWLGGIFIMLRITSLVGLPYVPVRGEFARVCEWASAYGSMFLATLLTACVIEVTNVSVALIRMLNSNSTQWPSKAFEVFGVKGSLERKDIADVLDLHLIASHTEVVGRWIYYPFTVLALLFVGQTSYLDDWGIVNGYMAGLAFLAVLAVWNGLRLQRVAEEARRTTLSRLDDHRRQALADAAEVRREAPLNSGQSGGTGYRQTAALGDLGALGGRATDPDPHGRHATSQTGVVRSVLEAQARTVAALEMEIVTVHGTVRQELALKRRGTALAELIDHVRGLRQGAFASFGSQPWVRAIIFPSGGIGLWAIIQKLLLVP